MKQYRKKPVVIEAIVFDDSAECLQALCDAGLDPVHVSYGVKKDAPQLIIDTLEGKHAANVGDYVIKGVKGEFYPCKPKWFETYYEEVR